MVRVKKPEILPPLRPRWRAGNLLLSDDNLDLLAHLLDDWFRIPGTAIRVGFDGLVGLIPGFGDVAAGLASLVLIVAAWLRGVPYVTLARMAVNVGIEVLVGSVPFAGDVFVVAWKANRRNYKLMTRHIEEPRRHTWKDKLFFVLVLVGLWVVFVLPLVVIVLVVHWLLR